MKDGLVKYKIPFIRPNFPSVNELQEDYEKIIDSNWFTNFGPYEKEFCIQAAKYVSNGVFVTTVANCTQALDIAIATLMDNSKKTVITQAFTFVAGSEMLIRNGFKPLFIDIDENTWQMDIIQAEKAIIDNLNDVAGILLCNTFGVGNIEINKWEDLSKKYELPLIIDSAAGFGSRYDSSELVGARGDCELFSLHATKPFAVGEGGLMTSRNKELIDKFRCAQNFGFNSDKKIHFLGTNAKMQELNCAIGLRQLANLTSRIQTRQQKLTQYKNNLEPFGYVFQTNDQLSAVAFASVLLPEGRDSIVAEEELHNSSIEARRYYNPALHSHDIIMKSAGIYGNLEVTEGVCSSIISLPLLEDMTSEDIELICNILKEAI